MPSNYFVSRWWLAGAWVLVAFGCSGEDERTATASSAASSGSGGAGTAETNASSSAGVTGGPAGAGGMGAEGSTGATSGTGGAGGSVTGCASPGGPTCPAGTSCCSGVPYPDEGICEANCNLDSDRALKHAFRPVDGDHVLERVASLEITEWSYLRDGTAVRHLGPMAQDFRKAFGLGSDAQHIHTIDVSGVSLSAIQTLHNKVRRLEAENAVLREAQTALERRLEKLEGAASGKAATPRPPVR